MSLQLKASNRNRNIKLAATAGAVIIGASYIILSTFPHLKSTIYNTLLGSKKPEVKGNDDNEPIELNEESASEYEDSDSDSEDLSNNTEPLNDESIVNVEKWSDENLKSWLSEVCIKIGNKIENHILTYLERNHSSVQCFS
ncbi:hypothetical protein CLIB1423_06S04588 [[Candida] railenensis]|uniref:Uncharacterized protein n=1 Tax=[Candida] railenensis TaxID=45579 RepID=A0A9P0VYA0_9ASCO|nr:hypothetical protein CLIB1423_06S04588 [[Candida] railenensis]